MCWRFTRSTNFIFLWEQKEKNTTQTFLIEWWEREENCRRMKSVIMVGLINCTDGNPRQAENEIQLACYSDRRGRRKKRQSRRMGNGHEIQQKRIIRQKAMYHPLAFTYEMSDYNVLPFTQWVHWLIVFHFVVATLPCVRINVQTDSPALFMWLHREKRVCTKKCNNPHWPSGYLWCMHSAQ